MQEGAKKRLVGAVVMVALAVIFVPMLFEDESPAPTYVPGPLPPEPGFQDPFAFDAAPAAGTPRAPVAEPGLSDEEMHLAPPEPISGVERVDDSFFEEVADQVVLDPIQPSAPPQETRSALPAAQAPRAQAQTHRPVQQPAQPSLPKPEASAPLPAPPKSRADGLPSWVVQVSSLGSPEAAGKLADKLKQAGFSAFVEQAVVNGKTYYRVRVGPHIDRANAQRTADMLRKQQKLDTLIQRYQ